MYECLYGYTPFACDDRHNTKMKILQHKKTLCFPQLDHLDEPSMDAIDLIMQLLVEKEHRLCSQDYKKNDYVWKNVGGKVHRYKLDKTYHNYPGRFVYDNDAEDIKRHVFFKDITWSDIHIQRPPFPPEVRGPLDTRYFDDEGPISDMDSGSTSEVVTAEQIARPAVMVNPVLTITQGDQHQQEAQHICPSVVLDSQQPKASTPFTSRQVGYAYGLPNPLQPRVESGTGPSSSASTLVEETAQAPTPKPKTKKKDRKRPRDIILRDANTCRTALEVRKLGAFLGYHYRRPELDRDITQKIMLEDPYGMPFTSIDNNGLCLVDEDTRIVRNAERMVHNRLRPSVYADPLIRELQMQG